MPDIPSAVSRGPRRMIPSKPVSQRGAVSLRLAEQIRLDESIGDRERLEAYRALPRNRREARKYLRGVGPWGLAKKRS